MSIMSESEKKAPKEMSTGAQRDGEIYIALGIFIAAIGVPVLIGTAFALERPHAAVVNAVCGTVLLLIGVACMGFGVMVLRGVKKLR